jgi:hypothetical protein
MLEKQEIFSIGRIRSDERCRIAKERGELGLSSSEFISDMRFEEKIRCALMEAVKMNERGYNFKAILDHVEMKYSDGIHKVVGEYLARFTLEGERFGFLTPTEDAETEIIRKAIMDAERERKGGK